MERLLRFFRKRSGGDNEEERSPKRARMENDGGEPAFNESSISSYDGSDVESVGSESTEEEEEVEWTDESSGDDILCEPREESPSPIPHGPLRVPTSAAARASRSPVKRRRGDPEESHDPATTATTPPPKRRRLAEVQESEEDGGEEQLAPEQEPELPKAEVQKYHLKRIGANSFLHFSPRYVVARWGGHLLPAAQGKIPAALRRLGFDFVPQTPADPATPQLRRSARIAAEKLWRLRHH